MNKYVFWSVSFVYSFIYVLTLPNAPKGVPSVLGGSIGTWIWLGLFTHGLTHFGKGRKNPSRNTIAFWISTVLFGLLMFGNLHERMANETTYAVGRTQQINNIPQTTEDGVEDAAEAYLEKRNALIALLIHKNPSFKAELSRTLQEGIKRNPALYRKWQETHSFDIGDLEGMFSVMGSLEKEFAKYIQFASDEDIYNMYQTEYKHMVNNN